ncbi:hypothetical protein DRN74_03060 [Candidatus Micrarchaeota archaeon]|nr:MAG: hypothetical protein DRN74_03060 [Candidatus Micrarchaeota archaeon]
MKIKYIFLIALFFVFIAQSTVSSHVAIVTLNQSTVNDTGFHTLQITIENNASSDDNITKFNLTLANFSNPNECNFSEFLAGPSSENVSCDIGMFRDMPAMNCTVNASSNTTLLGLAPNKSVTVVFKVYIGEYHHDYNLSYFDYDTNGSSVFKNFSIDVLDTKAPEINTGTLFMTYAQTLYNLTVWYNNFTYISDGVTVNVSLTDVGYGISSAVLYIANGSNPADELQSFGMNRYSGDNNNGKWNAYPITQSVSDGSYYFNITVTDASSNRAFVTWFIGIDNKDPIIIFQQPTAGSHINGTYNVTVRISENLSGLPSNEDNVQMDVTPCDNASDQYYYSNYGSHLNMSNDSANIFYKTIDTTEFDDGCYNISIWVKKDKAGNGPVFNTTNITIDNDAPAVNITAPGNGSNVSGISSKVNFTVSDYNLLNDTIMINFGTGWQLIDASEDCSHNVHIWNLTCSYDWDTSKEHPGYYNITVKANDSYKHQGTSTVINVYVRAQSNVSITANNANVPMGYLHHPVLINNTGNVNYNVTVELRNTDDWPIYLNDSSGWGTSITFELQAHNSRYFYVDGHLNSSIGGGNSTLVLLNFSYLSGSNKLPISYDPSTNSSSFSLTMKEEYNVSVSANKTVYKNFSIPQANISVLLTVSNVGNNASSYTLSVSPGAGLSSNTSTVSIRLNKSESKNITVNISVSSSYSGNTTVNISVKSSKNQSYSDAVILYFYEPMLNISYVGPDTGKITETYYSGDLGDKDAKLKVFFKARVMTFGYISWSSLQHTVNKSNCTLSWRKGVLKSITSRVFDNSSTSMYCEFNASQLDVNGVNGGGLYNITISLTDNQSRKGSITELSKVPVLRNSTLESNIVIGSVSSASATEGESFSTTVSGIRYNISCNGSSVNAYVYGTVTVYYEIGYSACAGSISGSSSKTLTSCSIPDAGTYDAMVDVDGVWGLVGSKNFTNKFTISESSTNDNTGSSSSSAGSSESSGSEQVPGISAVGVSKVVAEAGKNKTISLTIENTLSTGRAVYIFVEQDYNIIKVFQGKRSVSVSGGEVKQYSFNYTTDEYTRPGNYTVIIRGANNNKDKIYFDKEITIEVKEKPRPSNKVSVRRYFLDTPSNKTIVSLSVYNPLSTTKRTKIRETVPKDIAPNVSYIVFDNNVPTVIEADPVLEWTLDVKAKSKAEVNYTVNLVEDKDEFMDESQPSVVSTESIEETTAACDVECPEGYEVNENCECVFKCLDTVCPEEQVLNISDCSCYTPAQKEKAAGDSTIYVAAGGIASFAVVIVLLYFFKRALLMDVLDSVKEFLNKIKALFGRSKYPISKASSKSPFKSFSLPKLPKRKRKAAPKIRTKSGKVLAEYEADEEKTLFSYKIGKKKKAPRDDDFNIV